jgi:sugar O-acyltransferase (sialic acid O-acetyltransferase NeuD family)
MVGLQMGHEPTRNGRKLVVYGAGGHGRVVADAAAAAGFEVLGFLDDALPPGREVLGWRVLGDMAWLAGQPGLSVAHGIGENATRERVARVADQDGISFTTVVHPSAVVSPHARVGVGTVVMALAALNPGCTVGVGAIVNTGAIVEHDVVVGDFAHVASNAGLAGGARLGRLALLGSGATVLPGRTVGEEGIVGAGAVVIDDVPSGVVVAGVPARRLASSPSRSEQR